MFSILAVITWTIALLLILLGTWLTLRKLRGTPPHLDAPFGLIPVSILKPVKGAEPGLKENLSGFFELDYPDYELIFSIADAADPARRIIEEQIQAHPNRKALLLIGDVQVGPNPKVNNLVRSYEKARYDWILISDSNVSVAPDYLKRMVAHVETGVGVVTSLVAGRNSSGVGGLLEATYLNTFYVRGMVLAEAAGRSCVLGKSMLFRRSTAARFGGMQVLGRYLAEDYMAGEAMKRLGLKIVTAVDPVAQRIGQHPFRAFWSRHLRWGRIRKSQAPLVFAFEVLSGCMVSGLLGAWGLHRTFGIAPTHLILAHLSLWSFCDLLILRKMDSKFQVWLPVVWFLRELLSFPLWLLTASGNTVNWRGSRLKLGAGGMLKVQ